MIGSATLKPFLLHQDKEVRAFVAEFFDDMRPDDPALMPLVLEGCERYSDVENLRVLVHAKHFPLEKVETLFGFGDRLNKAKDPNVIFHLNAIISHAPVPMLEKHLEALSATGRASQTTLARFHRRRGFAARTAEELWQDLLDFAEESEGIEYGSQIDHGYLDDLIEALARHDTPAVETIRQHMDSPEAQEGWLEAFLVDLAGERRLAGLVPDLVARLRSDSDYLHDCVIFALGPIGSPEAVPLIRELFSDEDSSVRLYACGALQRIKHGDSEAAMLALLENERDGTVRTDLCFGLCKLFSRRGVDVVRREIRAGYDTTLVCLEDELLVVAEVLGLSLPEAPTWRSRQSKEEHRRKLREARWRQFFGPPPSAEAEEAESGEADVPSFAGDIARRLAELEPAITAAPHVGRNDPCPCGSGKKFKKCCARKRP